MSSPFAELSRNDLSQSPVRGWKVLAPVAVRVCVHPCLPPSIQRPAPLCFSILVIPDPPASSRCPCPAQLSQLGSGMLAGTRQCLITLPTLLQLHLSTTMGHETAEGQPGICFLPGGGRGLGPIYGPYPVFSLLASAHKAWKLCFSKGKGRSTLGRCQTKCGRCNRGQVWSSRLQHFSWTEKDITGPLTFVRCGLRHQNNLGTAGWRDTGNLQGGACVWEPVTQFARTPA